MVTADESSGSNRRIFELPLSIQRYKWVQTYIDNHPDIKSATDFGCGNGRLMDWLKTIPHLELVNFVDVDQGLIETEMDYNFRPGLCESLFGRSSSTKPLFVRVYHADMAVPDDRLNADCFILVEVIEHMMPDEVERSMQTIFGHYQPKMVIVTTPNSEFNHLLRQEGEPVDKFRHYDHKFEWNRAEFAHWIQKVCSQYPYSFHLDGVGHLPNSEPFGPCTQIAVFHRNADYVANGKVAVDLDKLRANEGKMEDDADSLGQQCKATLMTKYTIPGCSTRVSSDVNNSQEYSWDYTED